MKGASLETFEPFEEIRPISTPLSVKACKKHGISPEDLLYVPEDKLNVRPGEISFNKREANRFRKLKFVIRTRNALILEGQKKGNNHSQYIEHFSDEVESSKKKQEYYL